MTPAAAAEVRRKVEEADAKAADRQVREASRWTGFIGPLTWFLLLINSYFAARAMFYFADLGGASVVGGEALLGTGDRVFMVLTAASLIFAAHVLAVRLAMLTGLAKLSGLVILAGLALYSIITSTLCIMLMMQGGVEADALKTDAYQLAKTQAEAASARASSAARSVTEGEGRVREAEAALSAWRAQVAATWEAGSAAYNRRQDPSHPEHAGLVSAIERARYDLSQSQAAEAAATSAAPQALASMERAKTEGGGATSAVMASVARVFGTDTEGFIFGFSVFVNILMELARLFLAFVTGRGIADALKRADQSGGGSPIVIRERPALRPVPDPAPVEPVAERRGRAMPFAKSRDDWSLSAVPKEDPAQEEPAEGEGQGGERYGLPPHRRAASYQQAIEKARQAIKSGDLKTGGLSAIRKATGVSDQVAGRIQLDLEAEGLLIRNGARLTPNPAARAA
ncbi:hypothetical protein [Neomegalonema perideroedes]|uniref:hypothetical protein n=1 Tax=Neomegalonema perideroedes TaxID=217219 RepID=UPI000380A91B|nr:hypothetical protein [Neomegalonema perideroedes]